MSQSENDNKIIETLRLRNTIQTQRAYQISVSPSVFIKNEKCPVTLQQRFENLNRYWLRFVVFFYSTGLICWFQVRQEINRSKIKAVENISFTGSKEVEEVSEKGN